MRRTLCVATCCGLLGLILGCSESTGPLDPETGGQSSYIEAPRAVSPTPFSNTEDISTLLRWTSTNVDGATYTVYLHTARDGLASSGNAVATGIADTFHTQSSLSYQQTYYWVVKVSSSLGSSFSDVYSFTTGFPGMVLYLEDRDIRALTYNASTSTYWAGLQGEVASVQGQTVTMRHSLDDEVTGMGIAADNSIIVGTWGEGVVRIPASGSTEVHMLAVHNTKAHPPFFTTRDSVNKLLDTVKVTRSIDSLIGPFTVDTHGGWIGSVESKGLLRWANAVHLAIDQVTVNATATPITAVSILSLYIDEVANQSDPYAGIWFGTGDGLYVIDGIGADTSFPGRFYADSNGLPDNRVTAVVKSGATVWAGTWSGGIAKFDGSSWQTMASLDQALGSSHILCLEVDGTGDVWVGTNGGGVAKIISGGSTFTVYQSDNSALPSNVVHDIYADAQGKIWMATSRGLLVFQDQ